MNLQHELAKITAGLQYAELGRSLSRGEIEALAASGAITPPEQIPATRCFNRVSVPDSRPGRFGSSRFNRVGLL